MMNEEFDTLVTKAIENAPEWLNEDLANIAKKADGNFRLSYFISELYSRYTFGIRHITAAMYQNADWQIVSHDRLNYIDNNVDLIQYMIKRIKKQKV